MDMGGNGGRKHHRNHDDVESYRGIQGCRHLTGQPAPDRKSRHGKHKNGDKERRPAYAPDQERYDKRDVGGKKGENAGAKYPS